MVPKSFTLNNIHLTVYFSFGNLSNIQWFLNTQLTLHLIEKREPRHEENLFFCIYAVSKVQISFCFRYIYSIVPLLPKSENSSL